MILKLEKIVKTQLRSVLKIIFVVIPSPSVTRVYKVSAIEADAVNDDADVDEGQQFIWTDTGRRSLNPRYWLLVVKVVEDDAPVMISHDESVFPIRPKGSYGICAT